MDESPASDSLLARADIMLDRALYYTSALLLIMIAATVMYTVVARYVFNSAPLWAEDAPRVFFLWMTYLGIAVATRRGQNIRVTFFVEKMAPKPRFYLDMFMHFCVLAMMVTILWNVWPLIRINLAGTMLSTGWSNAVSWFPLPVGVALMLIYQSRQAIQSYRDYRAGRFHGESSGLNEAGGD
ncbi:MAG: TRAP transporter small permease [Proteobacteria bacterium]|nr:TRAP transporter small permease [Pseudomonadota bacterium]MDA1057942.1 TRAP transporter small permease [Pseudomonadota bacterium]